MIELQSEKGFVIDSWSDPDLNITVKCLGGCNTCS